MAPRGPQNRNLPDYNHGNQRIEVDPFLIDDFDEEDEEDDGSSNSSD